MAERTRKITQIHQFEAVWFSNIILAMVFTRQNPPNTTEKQTSKNNRNSSQKIHNFEISLKNPIMLILIGFYLFSLSFLIWFFFISQPANVRLFYFIPFFDASTDRVLILKSGGIARVLGHFH